MKGDLGDSKNEVENDNKSNLPDFVRRKREVKFYDGCKKCLDGEDILFSVQQIHSSLGHAGAQITYKHASDWFQCNGLKAICEYACRNCICEFIKPIVGGAAYM